MGAEYTVIGEWFPENTINKADPLSKGAETPLEAEIRIFCSCTRWSFNRLLEGCSRKDLKRQGQGLFNLNSRYVDDAILKAKEIIESQKALLDDEIKETQTKLTRAKKELKLSEKRLEKAIKSNDKDKIEKAKLAAKGKYFRVKKLTAKLEELNKHKQEGTIPKVIFGGRSLFKRVCKGKVSNEEWKKARKNRLYSRGDKTKGGNPNLRIKYSEGQFSLSVAISHLAEEGRTDSRGIVHTKNAPRIEGRLRIPEKHISKIEKLIMTSKPYTAELIRDKNGRYRAYITFELEPVETVTDSRLGYIGQDTNPDGVALANMSYQGQPEPWPEGFTVPYPEGLKKYRGEIQVTSHKNGFMNIKIPELTYSRGNRRTYLIGVLADMVTEIAKELKKPLAVENLRFKKDRMDTDKKFNRMASNFPYSKIIEAEIRSGYKKGVEIKEVWPAHTSTIGYYKYKERYGITIHEAAAMAIARRAMGYREKITKEIKQRIKELIGKRQRINTIPKEGRGMTPKEKKLLKKLEQHNGLIKFRQESFYSIWHELRELVYSSR